MTNKQLADEYLKTAAALFSGHSKCPRTDDWPDIVRNLLNAVQLMNQDATPNYFRHDLTPEELAQRESLFSKSKPLTLADLKNQVDAWFAANYSWSSPVGDTLTIGDFEIRRRK